MKEYKKLHLKNDDDSDRLIDHLNQGWELFREFTGWVIVCKFFADKKSPLLVRLNEILDKPSAGEMTIVEFEVLWNEAGGNLNASVSPAEPEKPVFRPHREWFEMLKEPLRSQALYALEKWPMDNTPLSSSIAEAFASAFSWGDSGTMDKWCGVHFFFDRSTMLPSDSEYGGAYELAKQCAPDGWEQQGAGE